MIHSFVEKPGFESSWGVAGPVCVGSAEQKPINIFLSPAGEWMCKRVIAMPGVPSSTKGLEGRSEPF